MKNKTEQIKRIARYIEGSLCADEVKDLEAALQEDAELRRDYLEYLNIDAAMAEIAALPDSETIGVCERFTPARRRLYLAVFALAASLICFMSLWLVTKDKQGQTVLSEVAVTVISAKDLIMGGGIADVQVGDQLALSHVQIQHGLIGLELLTGVELELIAPFTGTFVSHRRLDISSGRLNANVGEHGQGFTVTTPSGEIVDLGTEFGIEVDDNGDASVAVFSGQVSVRGAGKRKNSKSLTMWDGEAVSLRTNKEPSRLSSVNIRAHKMELNATGASDLIVSVTDNIVDEDFRKFYGIVDQGMGEGTIAYTNRPGVVWMTESEGDFPKRLLGADVVCPFHVDRNRKDLNITLDLKQPATVYVLWDKRRRPLPWLTDSFKRTGMRLYSGPWGMPWGDPKMPVIRGIAPDSQGRILLEYTVWCREVHESGPFTLGSPHKKKENKPPGGFAMYGIAVQPLAQQDEPSL